MVVPASPGLLACHVCRCLPACPLHITPCRTAHPSIHPLLACLPACHAASIAAIYKAERASDVIMYEATRCYTTSTLAAGTECRSTAVFSLLPVFRFYSWLNIVKTVFIIAVLTFTTILFAFDAQVGWALPPPLSLARVCGPACLPACEPTHSRVLLPVPLPICCCCCCPGGAQRLVIGPIQRMTDMVRRLAVNPLAAINEVNMDESQGGLETMVLEEVGGEGRGTTTTTTTMTTQHHYCCGGHER